VRELGEEPLVRRHDAIGVEEILSLGPSHIIISPGPCSPAEAGVSTEVVRRVGAQIPILGVCLGHQCIGAAYGGEIVRAGHPMHGKTSRITHSGAGLFTGLPNPFTATRYHSLVIAPASVPPSLRITATSEDGEIMAVQHVEHPVYGVQFHPESVLTEHGYRLLDHFLHGVPVSPRALPQAADGALAPRRAEASTLASSPPPVDLVR
jgi:anthranilate synthase component 2